MEPGFVIPAVICGLLILATTIFFFYQAKYGNEKERKANQMRGAVFTVFFAVYLFIIYATISVENKQPQYYYF